MGIRFALCQAALIFLIIRTSGALDETPETRGRRSRLHPSDERINKPFGSGRTRRAVRLFQLSGEVLRGSFERPDPVAVEKEAVDFIREDELLDFDVSFAKLLDEIHGL